jgi:hypothetical protein
LVDNVADWTTYRAAKVGVHHRRKGIDFKVEIWSGLAILACEKGTAWHEDADRCSLPLTCPGYGSEGGVAARFLGILLACGSLCGKRNTPRLAFSEADRHEVNQMTLSQDLRGFQ